MSKVARAVKLIGVLGWCFVGCGVHGQCTNVNTAKPQYDNLDSTSRLSNSNLQKRQYHDNNNAVIKKGRAASPFTKMIALSSQEQASATSRCANLVSCQAFQSNRGGGRSEGATKEPQNNSTTRSSLQSHHLHASPPPPSRMLALLTASNTCIAIHSPISTRLAPPRVRPPPAKCGCMTLETPAPDLRTAASAPAASPGRHHHAPHATLIVVPLDDSRSLSRFVCLRRHELRLS